MNVLIIEDEYPNALRLKKLLAEIDAEIQVLDILDGVATSVKYINEHNDIDLLFLDIQLTDGTGLDILANLSGGQPGAIKNLPVIFTTAFDQYAVEAFKYLSVDYLLKPIKEVALKNALTKFNEWYRPHSKIAKSIQKNVAREEHVKELLEILQPNAFRKTFICRRGKNRYPIQIQDIAYFYAEDRETWLMSFSGKEYHIAQTLEQLIPQLDPKGFFRANRKVICAVASIEKFEMLAKSKVKLGLQPIPTFDVIVSSERSSLFKTWIGEK